MAQKIWTVIGDYFATGEGRTITVWIGYAPNEKEALAKYEERFGEWYAMSAVVHEGVAEEERLLRYMVTDELINSIKKTFANAMFEYYTSLHFNFS